MHSLSKWFPWLWAALLPLTFIGSILWAVMTIVPVTDFYLWVSINVVGGVGICGGGVYSWSELERVSKESGLYFARARMLISAGLLGVVSVAYVTQLQYLAFRSFGTDLPFWDVIGWARSAVGIGGILTMGLGALSVRNKGDPHPTSTEPETAIVRKKWPFWRIMSLAGFLAFLVGYFGGPLFPLPSLVSFIAAAVLILAGWLMMRVSKSRHPDSTGTSSLTQ